MSRLAWLVWTVAAPTLMGILVLVVLVVPSLAAHDAKYMLPAAALGAVLALPLSYVMANMITKITGGK